MNVVIFGATGMVGEGALIECLASPDVDSVLVVGRNSCGIKHEKLREIVHADMFDFSGMETEFQGLDACFFCLGISAVGKSEAEYRRITFDLTMAVAEFLIKLNPSLTFCYVSGEGTDSTENGKLMWARVKGETENRILDLAENGYAFRPGYIHPKKGVRSRFATY